jgi:hypothetical protein
VDGLLLGDWWGVGFGRIGIGEKDYWKGKKYRNMIRALKNDVSFLFNLPAIGLYWAKSHEVYFNRKNKKP